MGEGSVRETSERVNMIWIFGAANVKGATSRHKGRGGR